MSTTALHIARSLQTVPHLDKPAVVTIGNFDGVHCGHQQILQHARSLANQHRCQCVVLTFSNHPSTVLRPSNSVKPLCSSQYKYSLLASYGADLIVTLAFTPEFALQTPADFLKSVQEHIPLSHLILGHDARIGKDRRGDRETILSLAKDGGFVVNYIEPHTINGEVVSSSRIRRLLQEGELEQVQHLLGRWPSFYGKALPGRGLGKTIGFPTLNLDVSSLCLPPLGVYAVTVTTQNQQLIGGVANLGHAPTVRDDSKVLLEVYLFHHLPGIEDHDIEVSLRTFLRPEKQFDGLEQLKTQLAQDVKTAQKALKDLLKF